jgi:tetratricopeptide (TPR) repeat protein
MTERDRLPLREVDLGITERQHLARVDDVTLTIAVAELGAHWSVQRKNSAILRSNDISCRIAKEEHWQIPTSDELHRLCWIAGIPVPSEFGPNHIEQALEKFSAGDVKGAAEQFASVVADKDDPNPRNNLAFCQIILGDVQNAVENLDKACAKDNEPLYELNRGIALFLCGDVDKAKTCLRAALLRLRGTPEKFVLKTIYGLVLDRDGGRAKALAGVSVEMAILINMVRMGIMQEAEIEAELKSLTPENRDLFKKLT